MEEKRKPRIINLGVNESVTLNLEVTFPEEKKSKPEDKKNAKPGNSDIKR